MRKLTLVALCMLGTLAWAAGGDTQTITVNAETLETLEVIDGDNDSILLDNVLDVASIKNIGGNYSTTFSTTLQYTTNAGEPRKIVASVGSISKPTSGGNPTVRILAFTLDTGEGTPVELAVTLSESDQSIITAISSVADATAVFDVEMKITDSPIRSGGYSATITYTMMADN